jgi:hypothetical protein
MSQQPKMTPEERRAERRRRRRQHKIRVRLQAIRRLKMRLKVVRERKRHGWQTRAGTIQGKIRQLRAELRQLGWHPRPRPGQPAEPGAVGIPSPGGSPPAVELPDGGGTAATDDIPEEGGNAATEDGGDTAEGGNWLFGDDRLPAVLRRPIDAVRNTIARGTWSQPIPLGTDGRVQTRPGTHALVLPVKPGLFVVQMVPGDTARQLAGDNVGMLPLLLLPGIASKVKQVFATVPPPQPGQPGAPGYALQRPPATPVGCEECGGGCGGRRRGR